MKTNLFNSISTKFLAFFLFATVLATGCDDQPQGMPMDPIPFQPVAGGTIRITDGDALSNGIFLVNDVYVSPRILTNAPYDVVLRFEEMRGDVKFIRHLQLRFGHDQIGESVNLSQTESFLDELEEDAQGDTTVTFNTTLVTGTANLVYVLPGTLFFDGHAQGTFEAVFTDEATGYTREIVEGWFNF